MVCYYPVAMADIHEITSIRKSFLSPGQRDADTSPYRSMYTVLQAQKDFIQREAIEDHSKAVGRINDFVKKSGIEDYLTHVVEWTGRRHEYWNRRVNIPHKLSLPNRQERALPWDMLARFPLRLHKGDAVSEITVDINRSHLFINPNDYDDLLFRWASDRGQSDTQWSARAYRWVYLGENVRYRDPALVKKSLTGSCFFQEGLDIVVEPNDIYINRYTEASEDPSLSSLARKPFIHMTHKDAIKAIEADQFYGVLWRIYMHIAEKIDRKINTLVYLREPSGV